MAIETTLTIATFLLIVGLSLLLRLIVMVPYRLVRRATAKDGVGRGWPEPARSSVALREAGSAIARLMADKVVPLMMFLLASFVGALRLLGRSFASGLVVLTRSAVRGTQMLVPLLDALGDRLSAWLTAQARAPLATYSLLSPAGMFEDSLWRSIAEEPEPPRYTGMMEVLRHRRLNPVLQPLMVARRQTI